MVDDFKEDFLISPPPCSFLNSFGSTFDKDRIPIEHYGNSNSTDGFVIVTALSGSFDGSTVQNIVASLKQYLHHFTVAYRLEVEDDFQCLLASLKEKGEKASTSVYQLYYSFERLLIKKNIYINCKGKFEVVNVDLQDLQACVCYEKWSVMGTERSIGRYRFRRKPKVMEVWGIEGSVTNPNFPYGRGLWSEKMQISDALDEWINDGCVRSRLFKAKWNREDDNYGFLFENVTREKIDSWYHNKNSERRTAHSLHIYNVYDTPYI
ncbi:hypothetical protein BC829DRAFT_420898 [Chytridium lagenaria]|nr:hypothetical protein BC829DRAFT_420898 [Chytridium lagenaria]